uniref:24 kDa salivary protein n=1 Tax=Phlebotomus ariasi TaxID=59272 RepID=Q2TJC3_9DIPT|nr:24 kDa salivary protein [Phlebotomus ariasi]
MTWVILCVALLVASVVAEGGIDAEGNRTKIEKITAGAGSDGKVVYTEGGSFPEKLEKEQKSVKKELGELPKPTNATFSPPVKVENKTEEVRNATLPVNATTEAPKVVNTTASTTTVKLTSTSTTTTTPKPKKPSLTISVEDDPSLLEVPVKVQHPQTGGRLDVEEPVAQLSHENILEMPVNHRDYIVPIVVLIFAIPMILGLATVVIRRFRDYRLTRHYRRMDYLVDGMYNE